MKIIERKSIPLWKWILLYFRPVNIGLGTEDDIACISFAKELFKEIYITCIDYFCISTGKLIKTRKLTRRRNDDSKSI